ncbi:hypothetical protein BKA64DRAFT_694057 [Cadophora sp. MPI-SDFR-AT-0126]|nr:hypothetical protein BKA64DRAFT_694057 [Leotiomycetes sp. MPI-SDFR-AT-0126]
MPNATGNAVPVYFEESWAILSSIGLVNVLLGLMVIGITTLSPLVLVPIVTSVAGSIANGLCYYAFYANYPTTGTVVAAAVADVAWLVSIHQQRYLIYLILIRVLNKTSRNVFMGLFWTIMTVLLVLRILILISRAKDRVAGNNDRQVYINHLHIGYFSSIALVEGVSAFFLLRKFASARWDSIGASSGLFNYLMQSAEVRLATLAAIGFSRAITYSFQTTAQSATNVAGQVDRFVYALECLFSILMFMDILASRLQALNHVHESSSQSRNHGFKYGSGTRRGRTIKGEIEMYSMNLMESRIVANCGTSTSQERIVDAVPSSARTREGDEVLDMMGKGGGISKTVEFEFHESSM